MKPDLRLKEIGAFNISTGHDIHAAEAASTVAIKNALNELRKIKSRHTLKKAFHTICIVNHWREHQWPPTAGGVNTEFDQIDVLTFFC